MICFLYDMEGCQVKVALVLFLGTKISRVFEISRTQLAYLINTVPVEYFYMLKTRTEKKVSIIVLASSIHPSLKTCRCKMQALWKINT